MLIPDDLYAVKSMIRSLDGLEKFSRIPFKISENAYAFVRSLSRLCETPQTPLSDFILRLGYGDLRAEIGNVALPVQHRSLLLQLQTEHEQLARRKEDLIVEQNFDAAAECRDKQVELDNTIIELLENPIVVLPEHVRSAIVNLGYAGDVSGLAE